MGATNAAAKAAKGMIAYVGLKKLTKLGLVVGAAWGALKMVRRGD